MKTPSHHERIARQTHAAEARAQATFARLCADAIARSGSSRADTAAKAARHADRAERAAAEAEALLARAEAGEPAPGKTPWATILWGKSRTAANNASDARLLATTEEVLIALGAL